MAHLQDDKLVENALSDPANSGSERLSKLLNIAAKTNKSGKSVTPQDIEEARNAGATCDDIHTTVLITAAFGMFNRYVDGLNTALPDNPAFYLASGQRLAEFGYRSGPE